MLKQSVRKFIGNYRKLLLLIILSGGNFYNCNAQFISSYGVSGGITRSNQIWTNVNMDPRNRQGHLWGGNGSFLVEFFGHPVFSWRSEIQLNQKGSRYSEANGEVTNRLNYACFNNFLKLTAEGYNASAYILGGPRIEYMYTGWGNKLHGSISAGFGFDFNVYEPLIIFTEFHYNPDIRPFPVHEHDQARIYNTAWEIRIGFRKKLKKRFRDDCPPVLL
jgi:hypothetical protein